jgi:hypothetical protein
MSRATGQPEFAQHLWIDSCELAGSWHRAAKAFKQAREDGRRRDHRDLLPDDSEDERAEEIERWPPLTPCLRVERWIFVDHPGEYRVSCSQMGKRGTGIPARHDWTARIRGGHR